ncbi:hypothetical protein [Kribbella sp. NPDC051718]|uniref:hypothetical protein n=1 Tax=Kribbella sp. NPDC051718 TaxID=3155168 RepID=UPI003416FF4A
MTGDWRAVAAAGVAALACAGVGVYVVSQDSPAVSVGKALRPTAQPGVPVPQRYDAKPVEQSPPVADTVPNNGTWLIGKEVKRGTYHTAGSSICLWTRLQRHPSGGWVIVDGAYRMGPQTVVLGKDDDAFATQGCPTWQLVP